MRICVPLIATRLKLLRKALHDGVRRSVAHLPRSWRFALYRAMVVCDPAPDPRLERRIEQRAGDAEGQAQQVVGGECEGHDAGVETVGRGLQ